MKTLQRMLLMALVVSTVVGFQKAHAQDLSCEDLTPIMKRYLYYHVKYSEMDAALQKRFVEQYVKQLDPTKVYLLKTDADDMTKLLAGVFDKMKKGQCDSFTKIQAILEKRIQERAEFAKNLLGPNFKFDNKVEFIFDPDKKPYPKTKKEAEEFLAKYVQFQIANYLATDMKLDEAKDNVKKNWDRIVKRSKETKREDIYSSVIDSYARSLDPHSSYFSKEYFEDFNIQMSLSLEGIGATLSSQDGFTVVEALVPGGAAAKSGEIKPKDKIVAVGQGEDGTMENVIEMDLRDVVRKIRGSKGSKVKLSILRKETGEGKAQRFDVVLVRDKINLEDEAASLTVLEKESGGAKHKLGVINLPSFYADSKRGGRSAAKDVKKILEEAKKKGVEGLVLDLSQNGGGSLDDAVKLAGLFFSTGNVVVQSARQSKEGFGEAILRDRDPAVDWSGPLVVLTSRLSASASEIVAGTLQDYQRAVVVGADHTFGKGTVQSVSEVDPAGAIKVTVGMFYIPSGASTQHQGVSSNVVIPSAYSTDEMGEKSLDYSLPPVKRSPFVSKEAYIKEGPEAWAVLTPDQMKVLKQKSKVRVDKDPEFKKLNEEIAKNKAKGKVIKLSEVMGEESKEKKEKKDKADALKNASKEEKDKEYLKRPDIQEATNVLLDLMSLIAPKSVANK